jgi:hypothetical protein
VPFESKRLPFALSLAEWDRYGCQGIKRGPSN